VKQSKNLRMKKFQKFLKMTLKPSLKKKSKKPKFKKFLKMTLKPSPKKILRKKALLKNN